MPVQTILPFIAWYIYKAILLVYTSKVVKVLNRDDTMLWEKRPDRESEIHAAMGKMSHGQVPAWICAH